MRIILLLIIGFLAINANGQAVRNLNGNATNLTMRGSTVIRTNLLVDATGTNSIGSSNVLEVVTAGNVKALEVNRTNAYARVASRFIGGENIQASGNVSGVNFLPSGYVGVNIKQKFILDNDDQQFAYLLHDSDGAYSGVANASIYSAAYGNFAFVSGDTNGGPYIALQLNSNTGTATATNIVARNSITTSNLTVNGTQTVASMYPTNIISPGKSNGVWGISADGTWVKTNDISTLTATNPASWSLNAATVFGSGQVPQARLGSITNHTDVSAGALVSGGVFAYDGTSGKLTNGLPAAGGSMTYAQINATASDSLVTNGTTFIYTNVYGIAVTTNVIVNTNTILGPTNAGIVARNTWLNLDGGATTATGNVIEYRTNNVTKFSVNTAGLVSVPNASGAGFTLSGTTATATLGNWSFGNNQIYAVASIASAGQRELLRLQHNGGNTSNDVAYMTFYERMTASPFSNVEAARITPVGENVWTNAATETTGLAFWTINGGVEQEAFRATGAGNIIVTNGVTSYATNRIAIAATGYTNTLTISSQPVDVDVYFSGATAALYDQAHTLIHTYVIAVTGDTYAHMKPNWHLVGTTMVGDAVAR